MHIQNLYDHNFFPLPTKHIPKSVVTWRELNPISRKCIPKLLAPPMPQTPPQLAPTKTQ